MLKKKNNEDNYRAKMYSPDELLFKAEEILKGYEEEWIKSGRIDERLKKLKDQLPEDVIKIIANNTKTYKIYKTYTRQYLELARKNPLLLEFPFAEVKDRDIPFVITQLYLFKDDLNDMSIKYIVWRYIKELLINHFLVEELYHMHYTNPYYITVANSVNYSDKRLLELLDRLKIEYNKRGKKTGVLGLGGEEKKPELSKEERLAKLKQAQIDNKKSEEQLMQDNTDDEKVKDDEKKEEIKPESKKEENGEK